MESSSRITYRVGVSVEANIRSFLLRFWLRTSPARLRHGLWIEWTIRWTIEALRGGRTVKEWRQ
jgi:hypothetical protein